MLPGVFFSFDGVDGGGKSTQSSLFQAWLRERGHDVVACRDPGTTRLGESVRTLLLDRHDLAIARTSEMLLYMAARAQLVEEIIRPALVAGKVVVSDRYLLANVVYQGHAGGLDIEQTWTVGRIATGGLEPDLTFVLDLPVEVAWSRLNRERDRMESQGLPFLGRVRDGFLHEAERHRDRVAVVDAAREPERVQADIRAAAQRLVKQI